MIVADTSLVVHLFNKTILTNLAQKVLELDSEWILPQLWREEYANVLSKKARKEQKPIDEVIGLFNFTINELEHFEHRVEVEQALIMSIEMKISVYDAHFVLLAKHFDTLLITEDQEIIKKCPKLAMGIQQYIDYTENN